MTGATPLVRVRGLRVEYPARRRAPFVAVDGVDLDIPRGRTVGLVGESGSGKSSLGNSILGLVPATGGTIEFDGHDVTNAAPARRRELARRMQIVFQDPFGSMNPTRTVGETVGEALRFNLGLDRTAVDDRVRAALADVGMHGVEHRYPSQFSGGQRQRIAIARAMAVDPDFVLCDEPVSALDLSVQAQVLNMLADLTKGRGLSVLFVSHDLAVVRYLSDDIVVLFAGRVVERGPASLVADRPTHPYTRSLLAAAPVPDPVVQSQRREHRRRYAAAAGPAVPSSGPRCVFVDRCPFAIDRCQTEVPELAEHGGGVWVACHRASEMDALDPPVAPDGASRPSASRHGGVLAPEVQAHLAAEEPLAPGSTIEQERTHLRTQIDRHFTSFGLAGPDVATVVDHAVPVDGGTVVVRAYHPFDGDDRLPGHVMLHGGGWVSGSIDELVNDAAARHRAGTGCVALAVEYRLAPEHPFPTAVHDVVAVLSWLRDHAAELGVDPATITIGGASAGANIAAAAVLAAPGAAVAGLLLEVPALDLTGANVRRSVGEERWADLAGVYDTVVGRYLGPTVDARDPLASPLLAPDLTGFPPTHVLAAELDPLQGDGEAFVERLRHSGVQASFTCYPGAMHGSAILNRVWPVARRWHDDTLAILRTMHCHG